MDTRETAELGLWESSPQARDSNNSSTPVVRGGALFPVWRHIIPGTERLRVSSPWVSEGRDQLSKALVQLMVPVVTRTTATNTDPDTASSSSLGVDVTMALGGSLGLSRSAWAQ